MTDPVTTLASPPRPSLGDVLRRVAMPLLLFSLVLTTLLLISTWLLLPVITKVNVAGTPRTAAEVQALESSLRAELMQEEEVRNRAVLPVTEPRYEEAKAGRAALPRLAPLRAEILQAAVTLVPEKDAIHLTAFRLDAEQKQLLLEGDVRNVGPRSMTVLAQFVSVLEKIPSIASVALPEFRRVEDPVLGMHSPFTLVLQLP